MNLLQYHSLQHNLQLNSITDSNVIMRQLSKTATCTRLYSVCMYIAYLWTWRAFNLHKFIYLVHCHGCSGLSTTLINENEWRVVCVCVCVPVSWWTTDRELSGRWQTRRLSATTVAVAEWCSSPTTHWYDAMPVPGSLGSDVNSSVTCMATSTRPLTTENDVGRFQQNVWYMVPPQQFHISTRMHLTTNAK